MKRSPDGKWRSTAVAYLEAGDKTVLPEVEKYENLSYIDHLKPTVKWLLVWAFADRKSENVFPTNDDLADGLYWFESEEGRSPDKIILPRVIGSHVFGLEIECQ